MNSAAHPLFRIVAVFNKSGRIEAKLKKKLTYIETFEHKTSHFLWCLATKERELKSLHLWRISTPVTTATITGN